MPLTIKPPRRPSQSAESLSGNSLTPPAGTYFPEREGSPAPPPASPLSPTLRTTDLNSHHHADPALNPSSAPRAQSARIPKTDLVDRPPSLPFSGDDATDAIALRAAISSLQIQRKKAEDDIRTLRRIKEDAKARPDDFRAHVIATATAQSEAERERGTNKEHDGAHSDDEVPTKQAQSGNLGLPPFEAIPKHQDIVLCPPINWDKYHVVGGSLDRMHNARKYSAGASGHQSSTSFGTAATYDPFRESFGSNGTGDTSMTDASRDGRKDSGASAIHQSGGVPSMTKFG